MGYQAVAILLTTCPVSKRMRRFIRHMSVVYALQASSLAARDHRPPAERPRLRSLRANAQQRARAQFTNKRVRRSAQLPVQHQRCTHSPSHPPTPATHPPTHPPPSHPTSPPARQPASRPGAGAAAAFRLPRDGRGGSAAAATWDHPPKGTGQRARYDWWRCTPRPSTGRPY